MDLRRLNLNNIAFDLFLYKTYFDNLKMNNTWLYVQPKEISMVIPISLSSA